MPSANWHSLTSVLARLGSPTMARDSRLGDRERERDTLSVKYGVWTFTHEREALRHGFDRNRPESPFDSLSLSLSLLSLALLYFAQKSSTPLSRHALMLYTHDCAFSCNTSSVSEISPSSTEEVVVSSSWIFSRSSGSSRMCLFDLYNI